MGNKSKCTPVGRGTVIFQRESSNKFSFLDVFHVLGMTKNLILVSTLQDKGYGVLFRGPRVGRGTIIFQRESGKKFSFLDVFHVLGMTKNLILVSTLQDKGYGVLFRGPRVYI